MKKTLEREIEKASLHDTPTGTSGVLKEARSFVYLAISLFCCGIAIGFAFSDSFQTLLLSFERYVQYRFGGRGTLLTIIFIFLQNLTASLVSILFGVLIGIVPFCSAVLNGIIIGALTAALADANQLHRLLGLVPHGIFELPAIFLAWGLGFWHGAWLLRKDKSETLKSRRNRAFLTFFRYGLPLLIIAAILEGVLVKLN